MSSNRESAECVYLGRARRRKTVCFFLAHARIIINITNNHNSLHSQMYVNFTFRTIQATRLVWAIHLLEYEIIITWLLHSVADTDLFPLNDPPLQETRRRKGLSFTPQAHKSPGGRLSSSLSLASSSNSNPIGRFTSQNCTEK